MFTLTVDDHLMIAHSLPDPFFGPAQNLHGATLPIHASFERPVLDRHGVVMDIGAAMTMLGEVLEPLRYTNLDEHPAFTGTITTTEVIVEHIARSLGEAMERELGAEHGIAALTVAADEHPRARASYRLDFEG